MPRHFSIFRVLSPSRFARSSFRLSPKITYAEVYTGSERQGFSLSRRKDNAPPLQHLQIAVAKPVREVIIPSVSENNLRRSVYGVRASGVQFEQAQGQCPATSASSDCCRQAGSRGHHSVCLRK